MKDRPNVKIILLDGSVHAYNERLHIPRNKHTEGFYQALLNVISIRDEEKAIQEAMKRGDKDEDETEIRWCDY